MDTGLFIEFATLDLRKTALEKELKTVKDRLAAIDQLVRDELTANGVPFIPITVPGCDEVRRIGTRRDIYAGPDKKAGYVRLDVIRALKASDQTSYMVAEDFHDATLRSYVLELAEHVELEAAEKGVVPNEAQIRESLPEPLAKVLAVGFKFVARATKVSDERKKWSKD